MDILVDADKAPPQPAVPARLTSALRMLVDPQAEYAQMFSEGWRFQRDFLYVPNIHGADYVKTKALYAPFVPFVRHRTDFNYLLDMLGSEVAIGHSFVRGGDIPDIPSAHAGLLGADFEVTNGRYRITRIYTGGNWNPELHAPLGAPGLGVSVGDYILADQRGGSDGHRQHLSAARRHRQPPDRVLMSGTVPGDGGADGDGGAGARTKARSAPWTGSRPTAGRSIRCPAASWHTSTFPTPASRGYTFFNRYYFAQQDRQGTVVDERFNGGGSAADYIVDVLKRNFLGYFNNPVGKRTPFTCRQPGSGVPR